MPFEALVSRLNNSAQRHGYLPLDGWNGHVGADRHGVWDWTWVRGAAEDVLDAVALLAERVGQERFDLQIWTATRRYGYFGKDLASEYLEIAENATDELARISAEFEGLIASDIQVDMHEMNVSEIRQWEPAEVRVLEAPGFAPPSVVEERRAGPGEIERAIYQLFREHPVRRWTNREVLRYLADAGFPARRGTVNWTLSALARLGLIKRLTRGVYTGE